MANVTQYYNLPAVKEKYDEQREFCADKFSWHCSCSCDFNENARCRIKSETLSARPRIKRKRAQLETPSVQPQKIRIYSLGESELFQWQTSLLDPRAEGARNNKEPSVKWSAASWRKVWMLLQRLLRCIVLWLFFRDGTLVCNERTPYTWGFICLQQHRRERIFGCGAVDFSLARPERKRGEDSSAYFQRNCMRQGETKAAREAV